MFLKNSQNSRENICARLSVLIKFQVWDLQIYLKKTLAQVLSCALSENFKINFFIEHLRWILP